MKAFLAGLLLGAALAVPAGAAAQDAPVRAQFEKPKAPQKAGRQAPVFQIVQDYEPDPAIWLLRDEDTRIYLFGTVHVLPEGFRWRSERLDGIVAEADELIVETTDEGEEPVENAGIAGLLESLGDRPRVSERLSPENGPKWRALGKRAGLEPGHFDRLPPLLGLFGIATVLGLEATGSEVEYGVETVLEAEFRAAGKPIGSIESAAGVLASLLAADDTSLIEELDRDLARWDGTSLESMLSAYAAGGAQETQETSPLWQEHAWAQGEVVELGEDAFGETAFGRMISQLLLDDRNRAWAGWLENRLAEPGTVLVAVGAAHLAGDNSVQVMLTERGLAAERLD
jgi:uncharacterized protein YbaP (TraB family)